MLQYFSFVSFISYKYKYIVSIKTYKVSKTLQVENNPHPRPLSKGEGSKGRKTSKLWRSATLQLCNSIINFAALKLCNSKK
jgi:hypothetical protein